jgi:hypothetical protein
MICRDRAATMTSSLPDIHPSTWCFLHTIYCSWYAKQPDFSLTGWLSDMRRAHHALRNERIEVTRIYAQAITVLEYVILTRDGQLPVELTTTHCSA